MEVILSAAYGLQSDCQTNPNEKVTSYVKRAMTPKPWPSIALWIPFIGKKVSKSLLMSKWGLHWGPVVDIAKKILRERRSDGEKREVSTSANHFECRTEVVSRVFLVSL